MMIANEATSIKERKKENSQPRQPASMNKQNGQTKRGVKERKKTDNRREGWEDGTPPARHHTGILSLVWWCLCAFAQLRFLRERATARRRRRVLRWYYGCRCRASAAAAASAAATAKAAAAAAPPGEAILARTDATGAGAGV